MILLAGLNLTKTVYLNLFQHAPCLFTLNIDFAITFVLVLILHKMVIMITMSGSFRHSQKEGIR